MSYSIIPAKPRHHSDIMSIFRAVTSEGNSYVYPDNWTDDQIALYWFKGTHLYTAIDDETHAVIGTFVIRDNKPGRGAHICNAGFMVHPDHRRRGIGSAMCDMAIAEATLKGYRGMQFNVVVSTNIASITLWKAKGFNIIGTVPGGFNHKEHGFIDMHVMFLSLLPTGPVSDDTAISGADEKNLLT